MEWINVENELPSNNGFKICWCGNEPGLIHYHKDTGWQNGFYNDWVTHWIDLVPPKEDTEIPYPFKIMGLESPKDQLKELFNCFNPKL